MATKSRADLILALFKFCRKEYPAPSPPSNRTVLEHMLYGCCLENATVEAADEAFAKMQENFFDWNEVRVTTASELAELMKRSTYPKQSAISIKKTLHGIFESFYQFDLDFLRKENLSKAIAQFEKFKGVSPFVVAYVSQHGLGGHSIPLDRAMMLLFYALGIVTEAEAASGHVTGLERTIPKSQGIEFASCVHPFAVAFLNSPFNPKIREQILKLNPDAKDRFPKRGAKKVEGEDQAAAAESTAKPATDPSTDKKLVGKEQEKPTREMEKSEERPRRGRPPVAQKKEEATSRKGDIKSAKGKPEIEKSGLKDKPVKGKIDKAKLDKAKLDKSKPDKGKVSEKTAKDKLGKSRDKLKKALPAKSANSPTKRPKPR